ncbi:PASTA domain-containing protein [Rhizohabitans arisaemae]|uniref:PASTA domain-containing protein n=1 Tax=Rhizohabitans arisaemae TaxID=2720610 RepID=UPI0024B1285D|nr:hypothetical protein [Rhizohabitans arisaemae]
MRPDRRHVVPTAGVRPTAVLPLCIALVLTGTACGWGNTEAAPAVTVTTTETRTLPAESVPPTEPAAPSAPPRKPVDPDPKARITVIPNVVGLNHQTAQDRLQAAGFYNLREEDATGQGRLLVFDRNWVVVSQTPRGGTRHRLDAKIVLRSKKKTDG